MNLHQAFSLDGERAIVTGGGTGIGKAIAQCLARAGARVLITGRREQVLKDTCNEIGAHAMHLSADIMDLESIPSIHVRAKEMLKGAPTILVNNAGVHLKKPAQDVTPEELQILWDTHVRGAMELTRTLTGDMLERKHGNILFITSMAALMGLPNTAGYTMAKSALLGLTRALAVEYSPAGVRVNGIAPGWIETPMTRESVEKDPLRKQRILTRTPMNRMGDPEDIGWAAVYLCSPAARFVTGQQLIVDGGVSIGF